MEHVPYDSTGVLERVVAGEVALACSTIEVMRENIKAGRLRSLAVTSARAGEAAAGYSRHGRRVRREIVRRDLSALRRRQK